MLQRLEILPVGWGFTSLHTIDYGWAKAVVITDGGTLAPCFNEIFYRQYHIIDRLNSIFKNTNYTAWIISHFDYDHVSLLAWLLRERDIYVDDCIIPFTYDLDAC